MVGAGHLAVQYDVAGAIAAGIMVEACPAVASCDIGTKLGGRFNLGISAAKNAAMSAASAVAKTAPAEETAEETADAAETAETATESATVETTDESQFEPGGNL